MKLRSLFSVIWLIWLSKGWVSAHPFFVSPVLSSTTKDLELIDSLTAVIAQNQKAQPDIALNALQKKIKLLQEGNNSEALYRSLLLQGGILRLQHRYEEARKSYNSAAVIAEKIGNPVYHAKILVNTGNIYVYQGNYRKALSNFFKALDIYEQSREIESIELVTTSIGSLFGMTRNYDLAIEYYDRVFEMLTSNKDKKRTLAILQINRGWAQYQLGKLEEAKILYLEGISVLENLEEWFFVGSAYRDMADISLKLGLREEALKYVQKSIDVNKLLQIREYEIESKIMLAKISSTSNKYAKVLGLLKPYRNEIELIQSTKIKRDYFELLFTALKLTGDASKALEAHEYYSSYSDSVDAEIYRFNIVSEHMKREYDKQIERARSKHEFETQELNHSRLKVIMVSSISAILVIAMFLWVLQRTRQRNREELQQLYSEFETLKLKASNQWMVPSNEYQLNKRQIEQRIDHRLNETDWKVLNVLLEDPMQSNVSIAEKVFLSKDGLGSSLRRMYELFDIQETKYKKIALVSKAIAYSSS